MEFGIGSYVFLEVFPIHDVIGLALRTTSVEIHRKKHKGGSILVCLVSASTSFQILRTKFPKGGKNIKSHFFRGYNRHFTPKMEGIMGIFLS